MEYRARAANVLRTKRSTCEEGAKTGPRHLERWRAHHRARGVKGGERQGDNDNAPPKVPLLEVRCTLNVCFAMPIGRCIVRPSHAAPCAHAHTHILTLSPSSQLQQGQPPRPAHHHIPPVCPPLFVPSPTPILLPSPVRSCTTCPRPHHSPCMLSPCPCTIPTARNPLHLPVHTPTATVALRPTRTLVLRLATPCILPTVAPAAAAPVLLPPAATTTNGCPPMPGQCRACRPTLAAQPLSLP